MALYTRQELGIRTAANFLLALAANIQSCRPYLKKYFSSTIRIPSDWIEVAELYQVRQYYLIHTENSPLKKAIIFMFYPILCS